MKHTTKFFKALSDPTRLRMLLLLLQRDLCVSELIFILEMEQSRISHQLRVLRNADFVEDIREGKWIFYRVSEDKKRDLKLIFKQLSGDDFRELKYIAEVHKKLQDSQKSSIRNFSTSIARRNE